MAPKMIDLVECAARLRLAYGTVYRLVLTGELKGRRENGRWCVDERDLERLERTRKQGATT